VTDRRVYEEPGFCPWCGAPVTVRETFTYRRTPDGSRHHGYSVGPVDHDCPVKITVVTISEPELPVVTEHGPDTPYPHQHPPVVYQPGSKKKRHHHLTVCVDDDPG